MVRMIEAMRPEVGEVVMGEVRSISQHGAMVHLIEYDIGAKLTALDVPVVACRIEPVVGGRIEPMIVVRRPVVRGGAMGMRRRFPWFWKRRKIEVSRDVPVGEIYACEGRFAMRKYVRDVLSLVAERMGRDIEVVCDYLRWPESVDDLKNILDYTDIPMMSRFYLNDSLMAMDLFTVRIENPRLLAPTWRYQDGWCWAVSLIRQFEALLKQNNQLEPDVFLSVQDLVNQVPMMHKGADGDIANLSQARRALTYNGVTTEEFCPLGSPQRLPGAPLYRLRRLIIEDESEYTLADWDQLIDQYLHIGGGLPVTASVLWYHSYSNIIAGEGLYRPTDGEINDPESDNLDAHTMVLTGKGRDRNGVPFLEFQDTAYGDINNGDRGYLRFARYPCPVIEMALMTLLPHD